MRLSFGFKLGIILSLLFVFLDNRTFFYDELSRGQIVGRDFLHSWTAANLASDGKFNDIYDHTLFRTHSPNEVNKSGVAFNFAYPPQMLTFLLPLHYLDYVPALIVWSILCSILYLLSAGLSTGNSNKIWLLALAPTTFLNLSFGQNGLLTAALLIGGLRALDKYPRLAGILFGLLTIKPHLGVLIPFALIAGRYWKTLFWASLSTFLVFFSSVWILGIDAWQAWFQNAPWVYARDFIENGTGAGIFMQISPFISTRLLIEDLDVAWTVQFISALFALVTVVVVFIKSKDNTLKIATLVTATYLVSPYMHSYDMAALSVVVILLVKDELVNKRLYETEKTFFITAWLTPLITMYFSYLGLPYAPFFLISLLIMLCFKALWPNNSID